MQCRFEMFNSLVRFCRLHFKFANTEIFLSDQGFLRFSFNFFIDDFLLKNLNFCSCINQFFLLGFVCCEKFLQTVCFSCKSLFKLIYTDFRGEGSFFTHFFTRRNASSSTQPPLPYEADAWLRGIIRFLLKGRQSHQNFCLGPRGNKNRLVFWTSPSSSFFFLGRINARRTTKATPAAIR